VSDAGAAPPLDPTPALARTIIRRPMARSLQAISSPLSAKNSGFGEHRGASHKYLRIP
jgi:hypothetical protein